MMQLMMMMQLVMMAGACADAASLHVCIAHLD
jgi:hypothetical protein